MVAAAIRGSGWIRRGHVLDWNPGARMPEGKWFGRFWKRRLIDPPVGGRTSAMERATLVCGARNARNLLENEFEFVFVFILKTQQLIDEWARRCAERWRAWPRSMRGASGSAMALSRWFRGCHPRTSRDGMN